MEDGVASPARPLLKSQGEKECLGTRERDHDDSASSGHKRSLSGNLLSKIPFLRSSSGSDRSLREEQHDGEPKGGTGNSTAAVQQATKTRRRKGSLRKTALLGKGSLSRERKGAENKARSPLSSPPSPNENAKPILGFPQVADNDLTPRPSTDSRSPPLSPPPRWPFPTAKMSLSSIRSSVPSIEPASSAASVTSPTIPTDASTTDDDDNILSLPRLSETAPRKPPSSSGDSYFPPQDPIRRRATNRTKSPLATQPQSLTASSVANEEEWDYTETAYWGYVILISTWLVFVIGMGSCLDVWSWAWDVGETPETTKELEDDPTLPIVGYYPALIVLTSIMAWVWVVVAWVGMKYFRHADLRGDDG